MSGPRAMNSRLKSPSRILRERVVEPRVSRDFEDELSTV